MLRLLRSVIKVKESDPVEDLRKNWDAFEKAELEVEAKKEKSDTYASKRRREDIRTLSVIRSFYLDEGEAPQLDYVREQLVVLLSTEEADSIIDTIRDAPLLTGGSYRKLLQDEKKAVFRKKTKAVLSEALTRLSDPLEETEPLDARIQSITENVTSQLYAITIDAKDQKNKKTYGVINDDMKALAERKDRERKEGVKLGQLLGFEKLDLAFRGLKKGELIFVAGFSSEGKTEFVRNVAYNQAAVFGYNVFYWSGEVLYEQMQNVMVTIHSADPKWGKPPLEYSKVRDAIITDEEQKFLYEVTEDWERNISGSLIIDQPTGKTTLDAVMSKAYMEHLQLENGLDLIIIDYPTLLDYGQDIDELYKSLKRHAISFAQGRGIPILAPTQLNRSGKKEFDEKFQKKGDAEYQMYHLAGSAEVERNADKIIGVASPDKFKKQGIMKIMDLKARDDAKFDPHYLTVLPKPKKIINSSLELTPEGETKPPGSNNEEGIFDPDEMSNLMTNTVNF
jgi:replicative DNA helicase